MHSSHWHGAEGRALKRLSPLALAVGTAGVVLALGSSPAAAQRVDRNRERGRSYADRKFDTRNFTTTRPQTAPTAPGLAPTNPLLRQTFNTNTFSLTDTATGTPHPFTVTLKGGDGKVVVQWSGAPGAAGYNVLRGLSYNGPFEKRNPNALPTTAAEFTDAMAENGVIYFYKVEVVPSGTAAPYASPAQAVVALATPPVPPDHYFELLPGAAHSRSGDAVSTSFQYYYNTGEGSGSYDVKLTGLRSHARSGGHTDAVQVDLDLQLTDNNTWGVVSAGSTYYEERTVEHDASFYLSVDKTFGSFEVAPTLAYAKNTATDGSVVNGLQPDVLIYYTASPALRFEADIVGNNPIDNAWSYTAGLRYWFNSKNTIGTRAIVGKNDTVKAFLLYKF